jgi:Phage integrase family
VHPESITQLFDRQVARLGLPRIRFHDLRHTHASRLVANDVAIKVVSERLGHAHPGFTMATYQHVLPGMGAGAATGFAALLADARDNRTPRHRRPRRIVVGRRSTGRLPQTARSTHRAPPSR